MDSWILTRRLEESHVVDAILKECGNILRCKPIDVPDRVEVILRQINSGTIPERKQKSLRAKLNSIRSLLSDIQKGITMPGPITFWPLKPSQGFALTCLACRKDAEYALHIPTDIAKKPISVAFSCPHCNACWVVSDVRLMTNEQQDAETS